MIRRNTDSREKHKRAQAACEVQMYGFPSQNVQERQLNADSSFLYFCYLLLCKY